MNFVQKFCKTRLDSVFWVFLASLGVCCGTWAFSGCGSWELLFVVVHRLLLVVVHGLSSCSAQA